MTKPESTSPAIERLEQLEFDLPEELIAQRPLARRDASRLLVVDRGQGHRDDLVRSLPELLPPSLFVVNETRVMPARLRGTKPTGGAVELLLLECLGSKHPGEARWHAMGRTSKKMKAGLVADFGHGLRAEVATRRDDGTLEVVLRCAGDVDAAIDAVGELPLPPYVRRAYDAAFDEERYQTIFAAERGAVAAPTAGLHFTPELVDAMEEAGHRFARVLLHVGAGTFRPVSSERLDEHVMHEERWQVGAEAAGAIAAARAEGRPVVAVGTTVVRTLESAAQTSGGDLEGSGRTRLFIRPPFAPAVVDHLLTNFHLPRSTLLALVMAFAGVETTRAAYAHAVAARYRFFSYGDAMLIRRPPR